MKLHTTSLAVPNINHLKKLSLFERRLKSSKKLSIAITDNSSGTKDPVKKLKQGDYDVVSDHIGSETELERNIDAFLQIEDVRPVQLNDFLKD